MQIVYTLQISNTLKISNKLRCKFLKFLKTKNRLYRVYKKKLNKLEIVLRLCKAPQCTKFFIEIGCLGTDNVVQTEKLRNLKF